MSQLDKNISSVLKFGKELVGTKYRWWNDNECILNCTDPFWASNDKCPSVSEVKSSSCACTGLINLMRRKLKLSVPGVDIKYKYAGGTWIWFKTLKPKLEKFDINKIYPRGTLLIRNYKTPEDQGHVAIIYTNNSKNVLLAKLLHCYPNSGPTSSSIKVDPGVTIDDSVGKSHFGWNDTGYYTHACLPKNWLL